MAIKPTGGPPPILPSESTRGTEAGGRVESGRFAEAVGRPSDAKPSSSDPVHAAVNEVAAELQAGRVAPGEPAVERVIERIVERQAGPNTPPAVLRERIAETQFVLADDPVFVARVTRMLDAARAQDA